MKKRQFIIIAVAIAILIIGKLTMDLFATPAEKKAVAHSDNTTTVFASTITNTDQAIYVQTSGTLKALNRADLFSEVQGVMNADNGRFKAGNSFKKGEILVNIRSTDQDAQLYSQRSNFQSAITGIMPDLKADYPEAFPTWATYLSQIDLETSSPALPDVNSEKLKLFLVGRGIYSSYHQLKNMEIINAKFQIKAPFDGVLIAANVTPGTLIRPGQALGTFIQPTQYELEASIDALTAERLKVGQKVQLHMQGLDDKQWTGKVARIVDAIDTKNQLSTFFVSANGKDLKDGMFMQANVQAQVIPNAFELPRAALVNGNQVYLVKAGKLALQEVELAHINENTVIIKGLNDGDQVLTKVAPSAYEGMAAKIYQEKK